MLEIVAHRGAHEDLPENSLAAFERAVHLGADAVEMDVRLTRDRVPVISHYFALPESLGIPGFIFDYTLSKIRQAEQEQKAVDVEDKIATLREVMDSLAGRIGLEIEIKGPEPECVGILAEMLGDYRRFWDRMELTSHEPALLLAMVERCPTLPADLLYPRPEPWRTPDIVAYEARHLGRLARARAVHLHPGQISEQVVASLATAGLQTHVWDANDVESLELARQMGIGRICTDRPGMALAWRSQTDA